MWITNTPVTPCPTCGHCPTCGRGGQVTYPSYTMPATGIVYTGHTAVPFTATKDEPDKGTDE